MDYDLLDKINFPSDLRELKKKNVKQHQDAALNQ